LQQLGYLIFYVLYIASITLLFNQFFHNSTYTFAAFLGSIITSFLSYFAIEYLKRLTLKKLIGGLVGAFFGLVISRLVTKNDLTFILDQKIYNYVITFIQVLIFYVGISVGMKKGDEFDLQEILKGKKTKGKIKILDTSVIIDGRIADVCETGFIDGTLLIPQFVLIELQHIADSSDSLKRVRGRRGLDIIKKMQMQTNVNVEITDKDFPKIKEVDSKLILLAQKLEAKIITNDYNLNKLAEVQGVEVLNLNALANALKPVVLPGETLNIQIIKEGKEKEQGIGYLDDGTMVVVEDGRYKIGEKLEVIVTSILQTTAGRMIFTKIK
jgi:uncharacterized protein YacL